MLDRLRSDCEYFLGNGNHAEKHLWAGSVEKQIAKMRELYNSLPEKPEWIPEDEVVFIHDAKTEAQRQDIFEKTRNGDIRILIGSTGKLGTGVNVQDRVIALHHLDVPWKPSDVTRAPVKASQ